MKKQLLILALALTPLASVADSSPNIEARVDSSKAAIMDFFGTLKGELETSMKAGGPINAINVCHKVAGPITDNKSREHSMQLARTSLKTRNPDNAADEWETQILMSFDERKAKGENPAEIAHAEVVEENGSKRFRFMKAIPTGEVCLKCHGSDMDPAVSAKLAELYPEDSATGYSLGDIRGAFTIIQDM